MIQGSWPSHHDPGQPAKPRIQGRRPGFRVGGDITTIRGGQQCCNNAKTPGETGGFLHRDPSGIRTRVTAVRGRRTRPLYDGAVGLGADFRAVATGIFWHTAARDAKSLREDEQRWGGSGHSRSAPTGGRGRPPRRALQAQGTTRAGVRAGRTGRTGRTTRTGRTGRTGRAAKATRTGRTGRTGRAAKATRAARTGRPTRAAQAARAARAANEK